MNWISPLYLKIGSSNEEKICIGLFAMLDGITRFDFSEPKIKLVKPFFHEEVLKNTVATLKRLKTDLDNEMKSPLRYSSFTQDSFAYLNAYSNGILFFSSVKTVAANDFEQLFNFLVFKDESKSHFQKPDTFKSRVKSFLSLSGFEKVDKFYPIDTSITNRYTDLKVEFIGKNGSLIVGKTIDFNNDHESVDKNLLEFETIVSGLQLFSNKRGLPDGSYNVYFNTPEDAKNKALLDKVLRDKKKTFKLEELDKLDRLSNQLERGNYIKFSEYLEETSNL